MPSDSAKCIAVLKEVTSTTRFNGAQCTNGPHIVGYIQRRHSSTGFKFLELKLALADFIKLLVVVYKSISVLLSFNLLKYYMISSNDTVLHGLHMAV